MHDATNGRVAANEACALLGVSRETLYAYVSRQLVRAVPDPDDARRSLYERADIDALIARKRRGRSRRAIAAATLHGGEPVLRSSITRIERGVCYYRGADAVGLSRTATLEQVAQRLGRIPVKASSAAQPGFVPPDLPMPFARLMRAMADVATETGGGNGPAEGGRLMRRMALAVAGVRDGEREPIHAILARGWTSDARGADLLRRALVLCADHELNASTYATRVTASTGARLAACLLAGLATLSGPKHGGIGDRCTSWMTRAAKSVREGGMPDLPADGSPPPGFGHPLYPDGDPRALELLDRGRVPTDWRTVIRKVEERSGWRPTIDLGLAVVARDLKLPRGGGLALFAVGRGAGWLAHALEQRRTGALIRPRAEYGEGS